MPDPGLDRPIQERASFEAIRYGSVWEDADILCEALEPVARGGRILSVASAGDNALALLTLDPAEVVAVDLSAAQLACLALRIAAFRALDYDELLAFLGVTDAADRPARYRRLRRDLPDFARAFWDARPGPVESGVAHAGKFEAYFGTFRRRVLPLIHRRSRVRALLEPRSAEGREAFYRGEWDTWRWRLLFRIFFGRTVMGRLGRDPEFFSHVEGAVAPRILRRVRHALTALPTHTNPYLTYILTGNYGVKAMPRYLRREHFPAIRGRLDRIRLLQAPAEEADGPFDGFNLSDIFEYMSPEQHDACYRRLLAAARPGARLVYWNMLVPRAAPAALDGVRPLDDIALVLHDRDRAFFYQALHVDEILDGGGPHG